MRKRMVKTTNRLLFCLSLCVLASSLIIELTHLFSSRNIAQETIVSSNVNLAKIPFTLGTLAFFVNVYYFYIYILYRTEETTGESYASMGIMALMLLTSALMFFDDISPYKFLILLPTLLAVAFQNYRRKLKYEGTPFEARFAIWLWEALLYCACLLAVGIIYALAWLSALTGSVWSFWAIIIINIIFLAEGFRLYLKNSYYFRGPDYKRDLSLLYGAD